MVPVNHGGEPLIVSTGDDGALRSWRLDGRAGPLQQPDAHTGAVLALAVVEHAPEPLIVSAGQDSTVSKHALSAPR